MVGRRRWRAVLAGVLAGVVLPAAAPGDAAAATSVRAANVVSFTHDAARPAADVVGSSTSYTRTAGQPLLLTISMAPAGRAAAFHATLRNVSGAPMRFGPGGVRVEARVAPAGRSGRGATVWSVRAPGLASLAPGEAVSVRAVFPLPAPGTYTVEATARY